MRVAVLRAGWRVAAGVAPVGVLAAWAIAGCGGGRRAGDTSRGPAAAVDSAAPAQPIPPTGATVEIRMLGDGAHLRFEPSAVTIRSGDAVRFRLVTQGPVNVAFDPATLPVGAQQQLDANMPARVADLSSPLLLNPGETYTISFAGLPRGAYPFHCTPRLAQGMKGTIVVE